MNLQPRFHIRRFIPLLSAAPFFLMTNTFGLGSISSPDELEELWAIDKSAYGAASIPFEKFLEWWRAYPPGLLVLKGDKRIGGAIGMWPITESAAARLREPACEQHLLRRCIEWLAKHVDRFKPKRIKPVLHNCRYRFTRITLSPKRLSEPIPKLRRALAIADVAAVDSDASYESVGVL